MSTPPEQQGEWLNWLQAESVVPVSAQFHSLGHLHALAGEFSLASGDVQGVLGWLSVHSAPLGLMEGETFQYLSTTTTPTLVQKEEGGDLTEVVMHEYRFAVRHGEWPELGRAIVVRLDPEKPRLVAIFNGHVPSVKGYGASLLVLTKKDAIAAAEAYEGGHIEELSSDLGWIALGWVSRNTPTKKVLVWRLKTVSSDGGLRDFIVDVGDGSILYASERTSAFVHQQHVGYAPGGRIHYSSVNPAGGCTSTSDPSCTNPAFSDSLVSRDILPKITSEWEVRTTPGLFGTSGWWRVPATWPTIARLTPFQNNHINPATDFFTLVLADTSGAYCGTYPPPCTNGRSWMYFGPGDTDGSVYGHEYGHNLLNSTRKTLVSQVGDSGKTTEALCDIVGVAGEDFALQRQTPCSTNSGSCSGARTDFKLRSGALGTIDLTQPPSNCRNVRAWIAPSFFDAVNSVRTVMLGDQSGAAVTLARDVAVEVTTRAMLEAFDIAPDMFPDQMDVYAATIAAAGTQWISPSVFLRDSFAAGTVGVLCP